MSHRWLFINIIQLFLFVIALCIPFEIRDLKYDAVELKTLPQTIGVPASKFMGIILCIICLSLEIVSIYKLPESPHYLPGTLIYVTTGVMIYYSSEKKPDYYAGLLVESLPLIYLGLLIASNHLQ
ncbi:MAG: hypothetical protein WBA16_09510 [Nonlabens sp.]